jgi:uncharacterized protein
VNLFPMSSPSTSEPGTCLRREVQPGVWLDARLAVWFAREQVLAIADLHWGYAASHRARGNLLPCWGDDEIAHRIEALAADYPGAEMLWLGDVVHAAEGAARVESFLRRSALKITLLAGNHDRHWGSAGERSLVRGPYLFHHGDTSPVVPAGSIEVIGHHHPAASWYDGAGGNLKLPALVAGPRRLILPAFSPWAAGQPWSQRLEANETLWAVAPTRIFPLSHATTSALDQAAV